MPSILVFVELVEGAPTTGSIGLIEEAARLGTALGESVHAAICSESVPDDVAASLGSHGVTTVHVAEDPSFCGTSQPIVDALAGLMGEHGFRYGLFGASIVASDVAAGLAARLGAGLVIDAVELHAEGGELVTRRAGLGDSVLAHCAFRSQTGIVVCRSNTFAPADDAPDLAAAAIARFRPTISPWSTAARLVGREAAEQTGVDISQADILVGGGRGLGAADKFVLCEDLAEAFGGAVAATRAVVDAGWYPYSSQVGQTGKTVTPRLYLACGISGAIQHKVGMQGSQVIVAINKDPNAPIFDYAHFGVVGDLHTIVPKLTELVRARRG